MIRTKHLQFTGPSGDFIPSQEYWPIPDQIFDAFPFFHGYHLPLVFVGLMIFPEVITRLFTNDVEVLNETPKAMRWVFAVTPILGIQLIGAAYFQAVGKAIPALLLTLSRQGFFFIPLLFILPNFYGELGVWIAFPVADILATIVTVFFLRREVKLKLLQGPIN